MCHLLHLFILHHSWFLVCDWLVPQAVWMHTWTCQAFPKNHATCQRFRKLLLILPFSSRVLMRFILPSVWMFFSFFFLFLGWYLPDFNSLQNMKQNKPLRKRQLLMRLIWQVFMVTIWSFNISKSVPSYFTSRDVHSSVIDQVLYPIIGKNQRTCQWFRNLFLVLRIKLEVLQLFIPCMMLLGLSCLFWQFMLYR